MVAAMTVAHWKKRKRREEEKKNFPKSHRRVSERRQSNKVGMIEEENWGSWGCYFICSDWRSSFCQSKVMPVQVKPPDHLGLGDTLH
jgi:hypothetical protein